MDTKNASLHEKLNNGSLIFGTLVSLGHPAITECISQVGYDVVWIDMEHTAIDNECLLNNLIAARAGGTTAWVRLRWNDPVLAKPILDMGAEGIIFPYVRTAEEAGYGPLRALRYGEITQNEYVTETYKECKKIIQLEHIDAINNLSEIVKVNGIDAFVFGPNDLSGSLGLIGQVTHPDCIAAYEKGAKILRECGIPFGVATFSDPDWLNYWKSLGATVFFSAADWNFVYNGATTMLKEMKQTFNN